MKQKRNTTIRTHLGQSDIHGCFRVYKRRGQFKSSTITWFNSKSLRRVLRGRDENVRDYFIVFAIRSNSRATIEFGAFLINSLCKGTRKFKENSPLCGECTYSNLALSFLSLHSLPAMRHSPHST